jgi:hypothetical protein
MKMRDEFTTRRGATGLALMAVIALGGAALGVEFWVAAALLGLVAIFCAG